MRTVDILEQVSSNTFIKRILCENVYPVSDVLNQFIRVHIISTSGFPKNTIFQQNILFLYS